MKQHNSHYHHYHHIYPGTHWDTAIKTAGILLVLVLVYDCDVLKRQLCGLFPLLRPIFKTPSCDYGILCHAHYEQNDQQKTSCDMFFDISKSEESERFTQKAPSKSLWMIRSRFETRPMSYGSSLATVIGL